MNEHTSRDTDTEPPGPMTGLTEADLHAQDAAAEGNDERSMLDQVARYKDERKHIADFWQWLVDRGHEGSMFFEINVDLALDIYHGIDRKQLDDERRALLEKE